MENFWSSRPVLEHILTQARARMVGPFAVLAYAIVEALANVPPYIVLPPIVGGRGSLNMCVAIVGPSGAGKGTAAVAARDGIVCNYLVAPIIRVPIGSGEGIARTYQPVGCKDETNFNTSAIFSAEEVDSWTAIASRSGSTLSAEVRKLYSGEQLGFGNAGKDTRVVVKAHTYRAMVVVGVQPERSAPILDAADGGLTQRFLWVHASDPDAPDVPPADPDPYTVPSTDWHLEVSSGNLPGGVLPIPDTARDTIVRARQAVLREEPGADALAAHALLTRLKVAAGLMALDGRGGINDEDWRLAGYLMAISDHTRHRCQTALNESSRKVNKARALAVAERDEIVSDRKLQRTIDGILRRLTRHPQQTRNQLRMALRVDIREYLDLAIAELLEAGRITITAGKFALAEGRTVHMSDVHVPKKIASTSVDEECTARTYVPAPLDSGSARRTRERQRTRGGKPTAQQTTQEQTA